VSGTTPAPIPPPIDFTQAASLLRSLLGVKCQPMETVAGWRIGVVFTLEQAHMIAGLHDAVVKLPHMFVHIREAGNP